MRDARAHPAVLAPANPRDDAALAAERWETVQDLLHEALSRTPDERETWLAAACPADDLRQEVRELLAAHDQPGKLDRLASSLLEPLLAPPPPASGAALPALPRYEIIERLGGGGMGIVYRARDARLGRDVALKFLPPHLSSDQAAKKRFIVEARAAAALEHPNICTIHEIGETDDGQLYIVMGCYEGETLDRAIARGPVPMPEALRIAAAVARGLGKAHDRGIIHRDVKPANIMLTSDGDVKILDFGIAKLSDVAFTQTGGIVGTAAYMSPEQAFGEPVDRRTDIWSLGVVLYEMITGIRPFRGPGEQALLFSILTQQPAPVASLTQSAPAEIDAIIGRALAKRPGDRFSSTQELLAALAVVSAPEGQRPATTTRAPASPTRTDTLLTHAGERRRAAVVSTGIAGYAALVERLAPDDIDRLSAAIRDAATETATRHGGIVNQFVGGEAVMLFGVAASHEDDFLRAVRATLDLHERVRSLSATALLHYGTDVRMRSGVHTGLVVAQRERTGDRRFRITGAPLDLATRLHALAESDAILISPECHRLVAPFIEATPCPQITLHADTAPVTPYRVMAESAIHSRLEFAERTGLTPYAGRSRELAALEEQLAEAARGAGSVAIVIGEAGSGKSRLLHELRRHVDLSSARLVMGRCDAYGGTTPYLPFVQVLRDLLELGGSDNQRRAHDDIVTRVRAIDPSLSAFLPLYLTLLSVPTDEFALPSHLYGEQLHASMLEALAALVTLHARRQPTVILLEDWHWSDEASRTALEQLGEIAAAHPLLIVVSCRPDTGITWSAGEGKTLIHLGPLDVEASVEIMRAVLGVRHVSPELVHQLHERTGGNPFFLEETCQALREEGAVIVRDGEAIAIDAPGSVHLPETVQAVIRTRLDRLDPEARDALRVASVIGREFARGVLDEAAPPANDMTRALERLRKSGLIQQTSIVPDPIYRFKHVLTQEVAYDTLLEHQRKTLHRAAGRAIEHRYAMRLDEHLERLEHHFSRAEEWRDAVAYGIRSADRASSLSQLADALATLDRVQTWLTRLEDAEECRELTADVLLRQERLCETLGLRQRQLRIAEELISLLAPFGPSAKLAEAYLRQGDVCTLLRRFDAADRALHTALRMTRERPEGADRGAERNVLRSIGLLRSHEGRHEDAIAVFEQALAIDRELGDAPAAAGELASLGNILRKIGRPEDGLRALEAALDGLTTEANWMKRSAVKVVMAAARRDLGDVEGALRDLDGLAAEALERRNSGPASFALLQIAHIHLQQGRVQESLQTYRSAVDLTRRGGNAEGLVQSLRALGEVLFGLGQFAEALPALREAAGLFAQLENREAEGMMWSRIAMAHERCTQPIEGHDAWEKARHLAVRARDLEREAEAMEGIARTARQQGMRSTAILRYEEALARAVETGDQRRELSLRNTLGILRWEECRYHDALRHYDAALRLCRGIGDRVHEGLVLNSLGATLLRLRRYDEARTVLEEAAQLNADTGQRHLQAHSLAVLGDVLLAIGRPQEARSRIEASLAIRREIADRLGEGWMLEHLARIHRDEGRDADFAAALDAARAVARETNDPALSAALERIGEPRDSTPVRPEVTNAPLHH